MRSRDISQELGKGSIITGKVRRNSIDETKITETHMYSSCRMTPTGSNWYIINKDNKSLLSNAKQNLILKSRVKALWI